jgi:hypothetical protein
VRRHGGVETARRLLRQKGPSKGLVKLGEKGRLDLAMEALVLDPAFASLFSDEERATASRRLDEVRALGLGPPVA